MNSKKSRIEGLFLLIVVLPTLLSCYYFVFMASNIYKTEAYFVVRSPQKQVMTGLSAMLQGVGFSHSQDDSYAVHAYILSRKVLSDIDKKLDFKAFHSNKMIDIFNRYGGLNVDSSFETLYLYFKKRVLIKYDSVSSITTIEVSTFSPMMAYQMTEEILQISERFITQLNQRGRQDVLSNSKRELRLSEQKAIEARINIANYRTKTATVDPSRQSVTQLEQIAKLQENLTITKTQLAQLRIVASKNPQIDSLETKIKQLKLEIKQLSTKITGSDKESFVSQSLQYEQLVMAQKFANKHYSASAISYQQALEEVQRKQLYLERIVEPRIPDDAIYPKRLRSILTTLIVSLIMWGILHMLLAGVMEHKD